MLMLMGLLPAPNQALAQELWPTVTLNPAEGPPGTEVTALAEDTINGDWEFDVENYRVLQSDGTTREEKGHATIGIRLSEVENGYGSCGDRSLTD
jgi:hypothetical protein